MVDAGPGFDAWRGKTVSGYGPKQEEAVEPVSVTGAETEKTAEKAVRDGLFPAIIFNPALFKEAIESGYKIKYVELGRNDHKGESISVITVDAGQEEKRVGFSTTENQDNHRFEK